MAILPPINRLSKEDLGSAPDWIDRIIYPLNLFLNSVYNALNKNINFQDNIDSQIEKFSIRAGAAATNNTYKFTLRMKARPNILIVGNIAKRQSNYAPIGQSVFIEWTTDGVMVFINSITGLTAGSQYDITVLLA